MVLHEPHLRDAALSDVPDAATGGVVRALAHTAVVGVDGWSGDDAHADHLAHRLREVVAALAGPTAAAHAVLATHEVRLERPHTVVSCVAGIPAGRLNGLLDACASMVAPDGAVAVTAPGLVDGLTRGSDPTALAGAWVGLAAAATGSSGRLVHFAGEAALRGLLTVDELLAASCVDEVVVVGGAPHDGSTVIDTRDFVRPTVAAGRVRLLVQPAAGGVLVPFEKEDPERCCEDH